MIRFLTEWIGISLSREILRGCAGAGEVERVRDIAKRTMVMERMEDLARGVARLNRAIETADEGPYRQLCTELNLPGDSIDDIPTREVLNRLVERMEALAADYTPSQPRHRTTAEGMHPDGAQAEMVLS